MLRLLGEPTRLRIVCSLLRTEQSVGVLADELDVPATVASQHLAKLRLSGLVRTRREGTRVIYQVDDQHVRGLVEAALVHAAHRADGAGRAARRRSVPMRSR